MIPLLSQSHNYGSSSTPFESYQEEFEFSTKIERVCLLIFLRASNGVLPNHLHPLKDANF